MLSSQAARDYYSFQETESVILVHQLLSDPESFASHIQRTSSSLMFSLIYGLKPSLDSQNPIISRINRFTEQALQAALPGAYLVDSKYFAWMEFLPRWLAPWRRYAEDAFQRDCGMFEALFSDVGKRMVSCHMGFDLVYN